MDIRATLGFTSSEIYKAGHYLGAETRLEDPLSSSSTPESSRPEPSNHSSPERKGLQKMSLFCKKRKQGQRKRGHTANVLLTKRPLQLQLGPTFPATEG